MASPGRHGDACPICKCSRGYQIFTASRIRHMLPPCCHTARATSPAGCAHPCLHCMVPARHTQPVCRAGVSSNPPLPPTHTGLQAYHALDKAVISSCLHAFCITCLTAWCERKRACPVCRGRVSSYYHTINSDTDFLEHAFPPEHPPLHAGGAEQQTQQLLSAADAFLADYERARHSSQQQQQQRASSAGDVDQVERRDAEEAGRLRPPRVQLVQERFTSW